MFNQMFIRNAIARSSENALDRRRFMAAAGAAGLGVAGATYLSAGSAVAGGDGEPTGPSDAAVLNFALNLEYLEGQFYARAVTGEGLPNELLGDNPGPVSGGRQVNFDTPLIEQYAREIAADERAHVKFFRTALGNAAVDQPAINLDSAFTAAAMAAGLIGEGETFDPYANENNFLLAAFVFEDVGVTAFKGAAPLISNKTFLEAAAGILAVEAYHAGIIRSTLVERGMGAPTVNISDARDSLDGRSDLDQGAINDDGTANIVPTDENGIVFSRSAGQVLNVVYLTPEAARQGGFFPNGVNGDINTSADNA